MSRAKKRLLLLAAVLVAAAAGAGALLAGQGSGRTRTDAPAPPDSAQTTAITRAVQAFAAVNGETQPANGELYETTRALAVSALDQGSVLPDDQDQGVYVVTVTGSFTPSGSPPDQSIQIPVFNGASVEIDPTLTTDGAVNIIGYSYWDDQPDLSSLGTATAFSLGG